MVGVENHKISLGVKIGDKKEGNEVNLEEGREGGRG